MQFGTDSFSSQSNAPPGASPSQFGGYGGGGYVHSGSNPGSPGVLSPPQRTAPIGERQSLVPLTIRQLLTAPDPLGNEGIAIDGKELAHITFIGQIRGVEPQSTYILYKIDDGTGTIDCKIWVSSDDSDEYEMEKRSGWVEGVYVRVVGRVQIFNRAKSVTAFTLLPIKDFNEVTYHFLEAIHVHALHSRESQGMQGQQQAAGGYGASQQVPSGGGGGFNQPSGAPPAAGGDYANLTPAQAQTLQVFEQDSSEEGLDINRVFEMLSNVSRSDIRQAVDYLSAEGHLYSTIDEEHFKTTSE